MPSWLTKEFLFPIAVALIASFTAGLFTAYFSGQLTNKKELSYTIDGPTRYLSDPSLKSISIAVNGQTISNLVSFRVRIWNSGTEPIDKLPVTINFSDPEKADFAILSTTHETTPRLEFGKIEVIGDHQTRKRFQYALLNPNDADVITILTNAVAKVELYAKERGLKIQREASSDTGEWTGDKDLKRYMEVIFVGFGLLALSITIMMLMQITIQMKSARRESERMQHIAEVERRMFEAAHSKVEPKN